MGKHVSEKITYSKTNELRLIKSMSEIPLSRDTQERKDHVHKYKTKMTYRNEYKTRMTYKNEPQTPCICDSVQLVAKRVGEQNV